MAWSKTYQRTSTPRPYDDVTFCGICGIEIAVRRQRPDSAPTPLYDALLTDAAAEKHLRAYHAFRYWLWRRLGERRHHWLVAGMR